MKPTRSLPAESSSLSFISFDPLSLDPLFLERSEGKKRGPLRGLDPRQEKLEGELATLLLQEKALITSRLPPLFEREEPLWIPEILRHELLPLLGKRSHPPLFFDEKSPPPLYGRGYLLAHPFLDPSWWDFALEHKLFIILYLRPFSGLLEDFGLTLHELASKADLLIGGYGGLYHPTLSWLSGRATLLNKMLSESDPLVAAATLSPKEVDYLEFILWMIPSMDRERQKLSALQKNWGEKLFSHGIKASSFGPHRLLLPSPAAPQTLARALAKENIAAKVHTHPTRLEITLTLAHKKSSLERLLSFLKQEKRV